MLMLYWWQRWSAFTYAGTAAAAAAAAGGHLHRSASPPLFTLNQKLDQQISPHVWMGKQTNKQTNKKTNKQLGHVSGTPAWEDDCSPVDGVKNLISENSSLLIYRRFQWMGWCWGWNNAVAKIHMRNLCLEFYISHHTSLQRDLVLYCTSNF